MIKVICIKIPEYDQRFSANKDVSLNKMYLVCDFWVADEFYFIKNTNDKRIGTFPKECFLDIRNFRLSKILND